MDKFRTTAVFVFGLIVTVVQAALAVLQGTDVISGTTVTWLLGISAVLTAVIGYLTNQSVHAAGQRALESQPPRR